MIIIKRKIKELGGSQIILLGSEVTKKLELKPGELVKVHISKTTPRLYFCLEDNFEFEVDDTVEEPICPICGKSDTVKLITHSNTTERRSVGNKMVKKDVEEVDEDEENEEDEELDEDEEETEASEEEW